MNRRQVYVENLNFAVKILKVIDSNDEAVIKALMKHAVKSRRQATALLKNAKRVAAGLPPATGKPPITRITISATHHKQGWQSRCLLSNRKWINCGVSDKKEEAWLLAFEKAIEMSK